jgi:hypothetical protein
MRFDLSDEEWALLEPVLPKSHRSARVDDRKIVNAIFYVLRTGCRGQRAMGPTRRLVTASTAGLMAYFPLEEVRKAISDVSYPSEKIVFAMGRFEETLPSSAPGKIAPLRFYTKLNW